jgi:Zn-dependent peptidase ImmA (M78 family)/DNA-binding XRE family transcriptional regulator
MFTPGRLSLARKRRRLTKKGLAELVGVTPRTILRYEIGEIAPQEDTEAKIASALGFPVAFFHAHDVDEPATDAASFRSLTAITAAERDAALAAGSVAFLLSDWIDQRFDLPLVSLIDLFDSSPEAAARSLRQEWALGERPITNMVHLLESKGVRVFSLSENTRTVDAFSLWRSERPFVFLNMMKTPEHSRFDAAHELGHLVLHRHGGPKGRKAEEQANLFASSFLMPGGDIVATLPRVHTIHQIVEAKKRWKVSAMALIYRLHKVGVLSPWQYRMFCIQASDLGYRTAEPFSIAREQSVVWQKVLTALWKERVTKDDIAKALLVPVREIENLLFGLANMLSQDAPPPRPSGGPRLVSE